MFNGNAKFFYVEKTPYKQCLSPTPTCTMCVDVVTDIGKFFQIWVDPLSYFGNYMSFFPTKKNTPKNTLRVNFWIENAPTTQPNPV